MIQPYSIEAEASVLGSMILSQKAVAEMLETLKAEDFYRPAHQIVFNAMNKLASKGKEIDLVTLRAQLADMNQLPDVGGIDYLIELAEYVPSAANVDHYAAIVLQRKKRRDILALADMAKNLAQNEEDVEKALEKIGEQAAKIDGADDDFRFESVKQLTQEVMDVVDDGMAGVVSNSFISTGYKEIDEYFEYEVGGVYIVGARTSMGKTSFAVSSALRVAKKGTPILFVTLEMPAKQLSKRCMAILGNYPAWWLNGKVTDPDKYQRIMDSAEELHGLPIEFASSKMQFFIDDLRKALNRMRGKYGDVPIMVVVDYIQLFNHKGKESRADQLNMISMGVKHLCMRFKAFALVLSQVNQKIDKQESKVPELSDFMSSSGITSSGDAVVALHRPEYYDARKDGRKEEAHSVAEVHILKNRHGDTGKTELWFQKLNAAFIEGNVA